MVSSSFSPGISHTIQLQIEFLLGEVKAGASAVPPERRVEFIEEMRAHLHAMLAARMADGLNENEAWIATHAAFGDGGEIGRELAQEWIRKPRIETEGAPLSARDKTSIIGRVAFIVLVLMALVLWAFPFISSHNLLGAVYLVCLVIMVASHLSRGRQKCTHGAKSERNSAMERFDVLLMVYMAFNCVNAWSEPLQSAWSSRARDGWSLSVGLLSLCFVVGCMVVAIRYRREMNTAQPWRSLPGYKRSPVAAEQQMRMLLPLGTILALLTVPIVGFVIGMQVWQVGIVAVGSCVFFGILALIVRVFS